jgi:tetratricopeptide (TPR) repeat protein
MSIPATPSLWNIPYRQNPFFTGREEILHRLHRALHAEQRAALSQPQGITGLGGIGKTQTVVEYAYRHRKEYDAVFWVRADSVSALTSGMLEMARLLALPELYKQDQDIIIQAVLRWLHNNTGWLLIYDNMDDFSFAEPFLPKGGTGHLLLTTRAHALGGLAQRLEVQKMEPEVGALLLLRKAGILALEALLDGATAGDQQIARAISEELDGLPLALDQAGAYIKEAPCPLQEYLTRYQLRQRDILRERGSFDQDYPFSVATTWSLSFEKVRQANPASAELIDLCAFLDPDAIPEEMIIAGAPHVGSSLQSVIAHPLFFDQAIKALLNYSLLARDAERSVLSMHRLVQVVLRDALPIAAKQQWMQRAVYIVHAACSQMNGLVRWSAMERCLPHALACMAWIDQEHMTFSEAANLPFYAGHGLKERARYTEAEPLFQHALLIWRQGAQTDNLFVAACLDGLAQVYKKQGKYTQAESLYTQALSSLERLPWNNHPLTATVLNDMAALYESMGRYTQAEQSYQRSLTIRQRILGDSHFDTVQSRKNLGDLYVHRGRYAEAEPLLQQALTAAEQIIGLDDPSTNIIVSSLAQLYKKQGRYAESEALYRRALERSTPLLGLKHPQVVRALNNLAVLYYVQEKYGAAELLYQRVLALDEEVWGAEHLEMATDLNNLATLYSEQEKYEQSEALYTRALAINTKWLGENHPQTITCMGNLAMLYMYQGQEKQAEELFQHALTLSEQQEDHLNRATILHYLAHLYNGQRKYSKAEPLCSLAQEITRQHLGDKHPDMIPILQTLAVIYENMGNDKNGEWLYDVQPDTVLRLSSLAYFYYEEGKYTDAELFYRLILAIYEQQSGDMHPDMAIGLNNLAELYRAQGRDAEAEPLLKRALAIQKRRSGAIPSGLAVGLNNMAALYKTQKKYAEAEKLYQQALAVFEQQDGARHCHTASCLNNLGELYRVQGKYARAEPLLKRALTIYEQQSEATPPEIIQCLNNLALLYAGQRKYTRAESLYVRALALTEKLLSPDHPGARLVRENYNVLLAVMKQGRSVS